MSHFSKKSLAILETCHPDLQRLMHEVIKVVDIIILQGHRTPEQHAEYLRNGTTKVAYKESKHSFSPSLAVDIAPYPINWKDKKKFVYVAGIVLGIASQMGISLRWGGDWNSNHDLTDQTFFDLPHFELFR